MYKQLRPPTSYILSFVANILHNKLYRLSSRPLSILDTFAGTGSFSLYLFRHFKVERIMFIEKNAAFADKLRRFLDNKDYRIKYKVIKQDFFRFRCQDKFDIVLIDPPYRFNLLNQCMKTAVSSSYIRPDSIFIIRHAIDDELTDMYNQYVIWEYVIRFQVIKFCCLDPSIYLDVPKT